MATTARPALRPYSEAARPSAKGRTTTNYNNNGTRADNAFALRMQRLRLLGIIGQHAALVASLAWGEARNG